SPGTLTDCGGCDNCGNIVGHRPSPLFRSRRYSCLLMDLLRSRCVAVLGAAVLVTAGTSLGACRHKEPAAPPMATPSVTLNHDRAPLGSPVDVTYRFVVANDA